MKHLRGTTLLKFLLPYIFLLSASFIGLYFIITFQLRYEYETLLSKEYKTRISNISDVVSQHFTNIQQTNHLIERNITFINARYSESSYMRAVAINELRAQVVLNPLLQDIIYVDIRNTDVLSAQNRTANKNGDVFIQLLTSNVQIPNELITDFARGSTMYSLDTESDRFIFFVLPKSSRNFRIVYLLNEAYLYSLINMFIASEAIASGLLFNGELILSTNYELITTMLGQVSYFEDINLSDSFDLIMQNTSLPGLQIAICLDQGFLFDNMNNVFRTSYFTLLLFVIPGFILIYLAMKITYVPLIKLMRRITSRSGYIVNDINDLNRAFDESSDEKDALINKINHYKRMVNETFLLSQSEISNSIDANIGKKIDRLFSENYNNLTLVAKIFFENHIKNNTIINYAESLFEKDSFIIIIESESGQITMLISISHSNDSDYVVSKFFSSINKKYACKIAYSDYSTNPMDIARLYDRACIAQKHLNASNILCYSSIDDLNESDMSISYPYQIFDDLSVHLKKLDIKKAHDAVDSIFDVIDMENSTILLIRCILIDTLTLLSNEINANSINFDGFNKVFSETLYLCRNSDYSETKNKIRSNMQEILSNFSNTISENELATSKIVNFVEENCLYPEFSLTYLASKFKVSDAYMSLLFKKKFKVSLTEYVWNIRLQNAKILLETTNKPIDELSLTIGYYNPSSFRRKFKKELGISPAEYRRQVNSYKTII